MRLFAFLFLGATMSGGAQASSIISIEPMDEAVGPSMIVRGHAPKQNDSISEAAPDGSTPSIIVLGEPGVANEAVAAIPDDKPQTRFAQPMVIRGGLVGQAFSTPAAPIPLDAPMEEAEIGDEFDETGGSEAPWDQPADEMPPAAPTLLPE